MSEPESDTELLLEKSAAGDSSAAQTLLARCQPRLRRMVVAHLDQRISARVDPSDVVQETLTEAFQRLPAYAREPAISFYPWLRQIAWQRLIKLHRAAPQCRPPVGPSRKRFRSAAVGRFRRPAGQSTHRQRDRTGSEGNEPRDARTGATRLAESRRRRPRVTRDAIPGTHVAQRNQRNDRRDAEC